MREKSFYWALRVVKRRNFVWSSKSFAWRILLIFACCLLEKSSAELLSLSEKVCSINFLVKTPSFRQKVVLAVSLHTYFGVAHRDPLLAAGSLDIMKLIA